MRRGDPQLHFWLTRSVARVMGLNFSEEMANERLTPQAYADMVKACSRCPRVTSCQRWLSEQSDVTRNAPPGCRNSKVLEGLARSH
jgi:hypothetical protein